MTASASTPFRSGVFDVNGREIELGDRLRLTFNQGRYQEHAAEFRVIWRDAAYQIESVRSETCVFTGDRVQYGFLSRISHSVQIETIESHTT